MTKRRKVQPQNPNVSPPPVSPPQVSSEADLKVKEGELQPKGKLPAVKIAQFVVPTLMLLIYLYLWFGPAVTVTDPWSDDAELLDSATKMTDPAQRSAAFEKAGTDLKRLIAEHPYHARVHYYLSFYYLSTRQLDGAIASAKEAIRLGSGGMVNQVDGDARELLVEATLQKAQPLLASQNFNGAYQVLHDSYASADRDKRLLLALGNVCRSKNDNDCAIEYFEAALKVDPGNAEIYMALGDTAKSQGRVAKAIEYLEKAVALDPKSSNAQNALAALKGTAGGGN